MWQRFANPNAFMRFSGALLPWLVGLAGVMIAVSLVWGFFLVPADYKQGDVARVMFVHVPAAAMSIGVYAVMAISSVVGLIWRHPVAHIAAKASAPIGAMFTAVALITGSIWGRPTWGAYWAWDPRLTFELIMFFFYIGYIALWDAFEDQVKAAEAAAILCLVGSVFAVLAKYSVLFWDEMLHQPDSISMTGEEKLHPSFRYPLLFSMAAFYVFYLAALFARMRAEIRLRRVRAIRMAAASGA